MADQYSSNNYNTAVTTLALPELVEIIAQHLLPSKHSLVKACLVCKGWNAAWTPFLWHDLVFTAEDDEAFLSIDAFSCSPSPSNSSSSSFLPKKYGQHIRSLDRQCYYFSENDHILSILPYCSNLRGLALPCVGDTIREMVPYLQVLKNLRRLQLTIYGIETCMLITLLIGCGQGLEHLSLYFPRLRLDLTIDTLMEMLDACPNLKELQLGKIDFVETEGVIGNDADGGSGGHDDGKQRSFVPSSSVTLLHLDEVCINEDGMKTLLGRCPNLSTIHIITGSHPADTAAVYSRIPEQCPNLKRFSCVSGNNHHAGGGYGGMSGMGLSMGLGMGTDGRCTISSSFTTTLTSIFQKQDHHSPLRLENLELRSGTMDGAVVLQQVSQTQAESLRTLNLSNCRQVTDSGLGFILRWCHQLESLNLTGTDITTAVMEGPQERWSCFEALKELEIRDIGVEDFKSWEDTEEEEKEQEQEDIPWVDFSIRENRKAFKKIRRRVRMLPRLRKLGVSFPGVQEFVQGFGHDDNDGDNNEDKRIGDKTNKNKDDDDEKMNDARKKQLTTPPKLHTLNVNRFEGALSEENLNRFFESYPYLRHLVIGHGGINSEACDRFRSEGITYEQSSVP
ncbi:hypothetical protein BGZ65_008713 [Modicella reniformis]|uniref:F-box domain-containing protein n=1 Tax=Modicella reniformis TaxID=1440133 RepID=A0A9P6IMS8_9FUNG|nr:hypothetical protein BGZ65_008713 [Modicella reniformis]